jgi:hypothetical protein
MAQSELPNIFLFSDRGARRIRVTILTKSTPIESRTIEVSAESPRQWAKTPHTKIISVDLHVRLQLQVENALELNFGMNSARTDFSMKYVSLTDQQGRCKFTIPNSDSIGAHLRCALEKSVFPTRETGWGRKALFCQKHQR